MSSEKELWKSEIAWPSFVKVRVLGNDRLAISMNRWAPSEERSIFDDLESMGSYSRGYHSARSFNTSIEMALSMYKELGSALETMRPGCTKETETAAT
jgi:hypothetical protein